MRIMRRIETRFDAAEVSIPFFVILYGFLYVHRDEVEESEPVADVTEPSPALPLDAPA